MDHTTDNSIKPRGSIRFFCSSVLLFFHFLDGGFNERYTFRIHDTNRRVLIPCKYQEGSVIGKLMVKA